MAVGDLILKRKLEVGVANPEGGVTALESEAVPRDVQGWLEPGLGGCLDSGERVVVIEKIGQARAQGYVSVILEGTAEMVLFQGKREVSLQKITSELIEQNGIDRDGRVVVGKGGIGLVKGCMLMGVQLCCGDDPKDGVVLLMMFDPSQVYDLNVVGRNGQEEYKLGFE